MLSLGLFGMFALFGNLDYSTVFSLSPYINETSISIIVLLLFIGATAKSAQIPLHVWLPASMEGLKIYFMLLTGFIYLIVLICMLHYILPLHLNLAPEARENELHISHLALEMVSNSDYLDYFFSISFVPPILKSLPEKTLQIITGNLLGDGSLLLSKNRAGKYAGEARYSMTLDSYSLNYMNHLYEEIYGQYCTSGIKSYPNINLPQHIGKSITQYTLSTNSLSLFTALHNLWYELDIENYRYKKIVPLNIDEMFSPVSLAY